MVTPVEAMLVETSERGSRTHRLGAALIRIGRGEDNEIAIPSAHISLHHLEITWDGETHIARDLGSKNGTLVNDERLVMPRLLRDGDRVVLPGVALVYQRADRTATFTLHAGGPGPAGGGLVVDRVRGEIRVDGRAIETTRKEYQALLALDARRGCLVSKDDFASLVWPENNGITSDESIEQLISRLRHKIEHTPSQPRHLVTVRGLGYRLER